MPDEVTGVVKSGSQGERIAYAAGYTMRKTSFRTNQLTSALLSWKA
jgi:hypothetical protein